MEITRESLQQRYSDLTDAELLRRARSGALTELAHEVALVELEERGISLEDPTDSPPASHPTIEFAEDEFDRNPYQAPRQTLTASAPSAVTFRRRIVDMLWFGYVGISALLILATISIALERNAFRELADPSIVVPASALVALVAWRLRVALLSPLIWVGCFAVNLALLADKLKNYYEIAVKDSTGYSEFFLLTTLADIVVQAPMLWGLARYAFGSRPIWKQRAPRRPDSASDTAA